MPSGDLAFEIVKPAAYEVDGLCDNGRGGHEHYIFDAFEAKDDAEARQKVLERSASGGGYRGERVVRLYRVPF